MEDNRIVNYILDHRKQCQDATGDVRDQWTELWQLYQNKQDWSAKMDWQARCFVPKIYMSIEQASSLVKRAVLSTRTLFKLKTRDERDTEAEQARVEVEKEFKRQLDSSNFASAYGEMIKCGFLLGLGIPKILWDNGLRYLNIDIFNVSIDPTYEVYKDRLPGYIIEYKEMPLAELRELAIKTNKRAGKGKKIYDTDVIDKIEDDFKPIDEESDKRERRGLREYSISEKIVGILEWWGDIISEDGKSIDRNQLIMLANEKYIIRKQSNPFTHKKYPYIPTCPILYPHRGIAGISLVSPVISLQYTYNNIFNMLLDNLNFSVNKVYECNKSNMFNPRNLTNIFPGKIVYTNGNTETLREVRTNSVGQDIFYMMERMGTEIEKGTAVTEFLMGTSGRNKTATEAELKTAQAQGIFDVIARDLERNSLTPMLEMSFDLCMQFEVIPEEFRGRYEFQVGGLSLLLAQKEQIERIVQIISLATQSPEVKSMTNMADLYQKLLDMYNLGDVFSKEPQAPTMEQGQQVQEKAAMDAKNLVAQLPDDQKQLLYQKLKGGGTQ